ncbi:hypothetical protein F2Q68_00043206 [Brassica cretica]|uniref:Uncharacterized protein n=1 Tax=Brassica cretica TaxID=69181 RepID=A0A8S9LIJ5_BRACR|nr:hypothetical protein F2Q68_00043206 [Brassica cretica]
MEPPPRSARRTCHREKRRGHHKPSTTRGSTTSPPFKYLPRPPKRGLTSRAGGSSKLYPKELHHHLHTGAETVERTASLNLQQIQRQPQRVGEQPRKRKAPEEAETRTRPHRSGTAEEPPSLEDAKLKHARRKR